MSELQGTRRRARSRKGQVSPARLRRTLGITAYSHIHNGTVHVMQTVHAMRITAFSPRARGGVGMRLALAELGALCQPFSSAFSGRKWREQGTVHLVTGGHWKRIRPWASLVHQQRALRSPSRPPRLPPCKVQCTWSQEDVPGSGFRPRNLVPCVLKRQRDPSGPTNCW